MIDYINMIEIKKMQADFLVGICRTIDLCKDIQNHNGLSLSSFKSEIKTLKISIPRQMGNSSLAGELFKKYDDSFLFLRHTLTVKKFVSENEVGKNRCFSFSEIDGAGSLRGYDFRGVCIVDEASSLREIDLKRLYMLPFSFYVLIQ